MNLKIEMMRNFVALVEGGNLFEASMRRGRSQSAISMSIKQLEAQMSAPLFEAGHKSKLTALGHDVYKIAKHETQQFDQAIKAIQSLNNAQSGQISIAAIPSVAMTVLPQILRRFWQKYPDMRFEIRDMSSEDILEAVAKKTVDIGISSLNAPQFSQSSILHKDEIGFLLPKSHHLAYEHGVKLEQIHDERLIVNGLIRLIPDENLQALHQSPQLIVHNTGSLITMVRAGLGITIMPKLISPILPDDVIFMPLIPRIERRIYLLCENNLYQHPAVTAFAKFLQDDAAWRAV